MKDQWLVALIPFSWDDDKLVMASRRIVYMSQDVKTADRKRFYEALLNIPWLAPEIRRAVMKQLGRSPHAENAAEAAGWKLMMEHMIGEVEAEVHKKTGKRSRGAVIDRIADRTGVSSETLRKRLQRLSK